MNTVAETILEQLGGNKFLAMTGAKNLLGSENSLKMTIPKNYSKANRLKITLTALDDYTMEFYKFTPSKLKIDHKKQTCEFVEEKYVEVRIFENIYFDQLQELFAETTHMYTRLF